MKRFKQLLAVSVFIASVPACNALVPAEEPPGVGEKAEKGYALSAPVIAGLEEYKADHGSYPEKLDQLIPDYLSSVPTKTAELEFSYFSDGKSYRFSFHYIGPGMNTCDYAPEAKEWKCSGAY